MLKSHEIFRMVDENKQNEFQIEVNWNPADKKSNDCQLIRFTFPDGKQSVIKREHLFSLMFACGTEEQQKKSIPQKLSRVKYWNTIIGVKATKDISKGEMINVPINLKVPDWDEDIIGDIKSTIRRYKA